MVRAPEADRRPEVRNLGVGSYKRVKGRSHTVEKRKASHPQKPHATSQPWRGSVDPDVELLSNQRISFDNAAVDIKFSGDNFMPYYEQTMMVFEARFAQWL